MFRVKYITRWKDLYFRMCRSEAAARGCNFLFFTSTVLMFLWFKGAVLDPRYAAAKLKK